jgi:hypothetical protein
MPRRLDGWCGFAALAGRCLAAPKETANALIDCHRIAPKNHPNLLPTSQVGRLLV